MFYPSENEEEVVSSIKAKAAHKGIQLIPVSTVDQAVREVLPDGNGSARVHRLSPGIKAILLVAITVATGLAIYSIYQPASGADSLNKPLRLEIDFHYWDRTTLKKDTVPIGSAASPRDEIVLRSGDYYRFSITASDSCYLYVYQVDTQGKVDRMPDPVPISEPGFLEASITYFLPGAFSRFYLDEQTGRETIYFVGSRRRSKDLEETYQRFLQVPEMKKDGLRRALLEKIETRDRAGSEGVKGVFYAVFTFRHDPRMQIHNAPD